MNKNQKKFLIFVVMFAVSFSSILPFRGFHVLQGEEINVSALRFFSTVKEAKMEDKPDIEVYPGGQSIGVTLQTKGVLVVGFAPIVDELGSEQYPAKDAGIKVGDVILTIDGIKAANDVQVAQQIDISCQKKSEISVEMKRDGKIETTSITPVYCRETKRFRIGLYIRDEAAGVGTITFVEPDTKLYGALGHVIADADTNHPIEVSEGKITECDIYAVEKGVRGNPGEKIGSFATESQINGTIEKNTATGIFGVCEGSFVSEFFPEPVKVGWKEEVEIGPAKMYTVLEKDIVKEYEIMIEKVALKQESKNMIIRVTDAGLLEKTGGIVQGMSGSPIIQNGKIIGAVTHVFVNDATRGYGVFIENMLYDAGILDNAALKPAA